MRKKLRSEFDSRQYMLSRDFEVFYYSDLHFSSVGRHSHPYTEVYLFCEGEVDMEIEGRAYPLRPGDVLVLPPGTRHSAAVRSGDTPYRRFVFWLSEDFCRLLRTESPDYLKCFDRVRQTGDYILPLEALEFNSLRGKLYALLEELHTDHFGRDTQIGICVRDLLLTLNRIAWQQKNPKARKKTLTSYQVVTDYIAEHLDGDLSLDALGRELYMSKYYIAHLMQENTGLSLHQYITKKRLSACYEAMQSGLGIGDCCARYGFLNYSSFYRAFLKEYGCSPSTFIQERMLNAAAGERRTEGA